ncbi:MAG: septum formation initiator family protein [Cytophagales bacterium]|nr:septum formation initiator family protein [Cytophagales bacterium]
MKEKIIEIWGVIDAYIPSFLRNPYISISLLFVFWTLFFDSNNLFTYLEERDKKQDLQAQKRFYEEKIKTVREEMESLENDKRLLEKFARERYYFQKTGEDVFVLVEEGESTPAE